MQGFSLEGGKKKLKRWIPGIFDNGWLKLISLGLAIILWFFVTNYQDPETVLTISNVPVKLLHTEIITSEGKIYIVRDDTDTIPVVTINAPRSVVDALEADNVVATADIMNMSEDFQVPIMITTNKYSNSITNITGSIRYVNLSVEDEAMASFPITAAVSGNVAEGYQIGQISLEQNQVRVIGPKSEVESVKSVGVVVDVTDADASISTNAEIHLYDAEGRDINVDEELTLNIDKTMVRVEVLALKEIPIKIAVSGTPAEGFRLTGETSVEPGRITVAGRKAALESVNSVSIPSSELNVSGKNRNLVKTFTISDYLDDRVQLAEGEADTVKVTVEIVATEDEPTE